MPSNSLCLFVRFMPAYALAVPSSPHTIISFVVVVIPLFSLPLRRFRLYHIRLRGSLLPRVRSNNTNTKRLKSEIYRLEVKKKKKATQKNKRKNNLFGLNPKLLNLLVFASSLSRLSRPYAILSTVLYTPILQPSIFPSTATKKHKLALATRTPSLSAYLSLFSYSIGQLVGSTDLS
jgi:hypothetical protein